MPIFATLRTVPSFINLGTRYLLGGPPTAAHSAGRMPSQRAARALQWLGFEKGMNVIGIMGPAPAGAVLSHIDSQKIARRISGNLPTCIPFWGERIGCMESQKAGEVLCLIDGAAAREMLWIALPLMGGVLRVGVVLDWIFDNRGAKRLGELLMAKPLRKEKYGPGLAIPVDLLELLKEDKAAAVIDSLNTEDALLVLSKLGEGFNVKPRNIIDQFVILYPQKAHNLLRSRLADPATVPVLSYEATAKLAEVCSPNEIANILVDLHSSCRSLYDFIELLFGTNRDGVLAKGFLGMDPEKAADILGYGRSMDIETAKKIFLAMAPLKEVDKTAGLLVRLFYPRAAVILTAIQKENRVFAQQLLEAMAKQNKSWTDKIRALIPLDDEHNYHP